MDIPTIARIGLKPDTLQDETVIVTGAGGGIGLETARSLLWLGANVVIAEINAKAGSQAQATLTAQFDPRRVLFVRTDVGDEASVRNLYLQSVQRFGKVDAIINNATIAVLGMVKDLPIDQWDASYRVNLRGPVLMARTFLPDMIARKHGTFACVSSTGTAYLGGYETFKAAQVHLGNTLDEELEGTGVIAYTIGPGLVPTQTASEAVDKLAPLMGMTVEQFFEMNKGIVLSPEEAGAGFAASIVFAERFKGLEISSIQALKAGDITFGSDRTGEAAIEVKAGDREQALEYCRQVLATLTEQSAGWKKRSIFERQWVNRDFRKIAGMPVEEWLETLKRQETGLQGAGDVDLPPLPKLAAYYNHQADLAKGFEKNAAKLEESLRYVYGWRDEVEQLVKALAN